MKDLFYRYVFKDPNNKHDLSRNNRPPECAGNYAWATYEMDMGELDRLQTVIEEQFNNVEFFRSYGIPKANGEGEYTARLLIVFDNKADDSHFLFLADSGKFQ